METKKKIYIIASAFFLIAMFLILFFIYPLFKEISKKSRELVTQRNNLLFLEGQFNEVEKFKKNYETYRPNLDKIDNLFVDSQNPVNFIEYLEETASASGIELKISAPTILKEKTSLYDKFQFSSTGGFSGTLKFIKNLETGPYLVQIQNISIGNIKDSQTSVGANIAIKVFAK